tara:strand:- start:687 stop:914 length:228 start_codon:yes stop_codon:yes gene_type:complete
MEKTKASRPTKVRKKPQPKVEKLKTLEQNDIAKPTNLVGEPTVGLDPDFVTTVGLGKLKVTTARGYKDTNNSKED